MKKGLLLAFIFIAALLDLSAQKASYSRQTVRVQYGNVVQLIANISTYNHLLVIRQKKRPLLHVYDHALKLQHSMELPFSFPGNCDIQIFKFPGHYYLFTHDQKSKRYLFYKVDHLGNVSDMLPQFRNLVSTYFIDTTAMVQVGSDSSSLYLTTKVYYPHSEKLRISEIKTDPLLNHVRFERIAVPFDISKERLHHVLVLNNEQLVLLKGVQNDNAENLLEVMKVNKSTGDIESVQFNLHFNMYVEPGLKYNRIDSTILVYSEIREASIATIPRRFLMMSKLDSSLHPIVPATLKRYVTRYSFYLDKDNNNPWLNFSGRTLNMYSSELFPSKSYVANNYYQTPEKRGNGIRYQALQRSTPFTGRSSGGYYSIKFSIIDDQFKEISDSAFFSNINGGALIADGFGRFRWKNKSFLLMKQQLTARNIGLVLIGSNDLFEINVTEVPVYSRYDYLISQMQQVKDGGVIMPYMNKHEAGLMKLRFE